LKMTEKADDAFPEESQAEQEPDERPPGESSGPDPNHIKGDDRKRKQKVEGDRAADPKPGLGPAIEGRRFLVRPRQETPERRQRIRPVGGDVALALQNRVRFRKSRAAFPEDIPETTALGRGPDKQEGIAAAGDPPAFSHQALGVGERTSRTSPAGRNSSLITSSLGPLSKRRPKRDKGRLPTASPEERLITNRTIPSIAPARAKNPKPEGMTGPNRPPGVPKIWRKKRKAGGPAASVSRRAE
jgi:hypothetical protein